MKSLQLKRAVVLFVASATVSGVLSSTRDAAAVWRNEHAVSYCQSVGGGIASLNSTGQAIVNTSSSAYATILCPVLDDSAVMKESLTGLSVDGWDNNGGTAGNNHDRVTAQTCIAYRSAAGGACDSASSTSLGFTGNFGLQPGRFYWTTTNQGEFGYVLVTLPDQSPPYPSQFRGIYLWG